MNEFQEKLKGKMRRFINLVYKLTQSFPKDELYGLTSQLRSSAISVHLNYTEGYARRKPLVRLNFMEIAYGSCQEAKLALEIAVDLGYVQHESSELLEVRSLGEEVGAMLWSELSKLDTSN